MPTAAKSDPKYCCHKPSGRAYLRIRGRVHYCGKYGTPESLEEYGRLVAEAAAQVTAPALIAPPTAFTLVELAAAYLDLAEGYYVKDGQP